MSNITTKLELTKLTGAKVSKAKDGKTWIGIPIEQSHLFLSEKGRVYLDLFHYERDDDYGNNFMVTRSVSKSEREAGEKGEILGNSKYFGQNRTEQTNEPEQSSSNNNDSSDDLPF